MASKNFEKNYAKKRHRDDVRGQRKHINNAISAFSDARHKIYRPLKTAYEPTQNARRKHFEGKRIVRQLMNELHIPHLPHAGHYHAESRNDLTTSSFDS